MPKVSKIEMEKFSAAASSARARLPSEPSVSQFRLSTHAWQDTNFLFFCPAQFHSSRFSPPEYGGLVLHQRRRRMAKMGASNYSLKLLLPLQHIAV